MYPHVSRYGRRSNWFKIHCLMQQATSPSSSTPPLSLFPHTSSISSSSTSSFSWSKSKDRKNTSFGTSSRSPSPADSGSDTANGFSRRSAASRSPLRPQSGSPPHQRPFHPLPLLTSSPVKERPPSGIPSPAVRPQASPAALYSPLWLASSFYGLSKLSPLLGQHPFLLLQVYYCI